MPRDAGACGGIPIARPRYPGPAVASSSLRIHVVGGGIVGLACALRLQDEGHRVTIVARDALEDTTSAVAAAVWFPYLAEPRERVLAWASATRRTLMRLGADPASAIVERELVELSVREVTGDPWWGGAVERVERLQPDEVPAEFAGGLRVRVPVVASLPHLVWLRARFMGRGGAWEQRALDRRGLDALLAASDVVVHCAGLGAAALEGDPEVVPVRGQVVRVANPGVERCTVADEGPYGIAYVVPRGDDVILGGTADEGESDRTPDPDVTERILRAAAALEPWLARPDVLDVRVGLRPVRSRVRLERDERGVVHCYGHGGSGYTLSWGCADEVAALLATTAR